MTFSLTPDQVTKVRAWECNHVGVTRFVGARCTYHINGGAIGGAVTFEFTPTSIGTVEEVVCSCGAKLNLTDYDAF